MDKLAYIWKCRPAVDTLAWRDVVCEIDSASGCLQVAYYGDADFATDDVMLVHDVTMADDPSADVSAMLHSLPVEVQALFSRIRQIWVDKVEYGPTRESSAPL